MAKDLSVHQEACVVDAHTDIPYHLLVRKGSKGDPLLDEHLPLLLEGGLGLVFANLYSPTHTGALNKVLFQLAALNRAIEQSSKLMMIKTGEDLRDSINKEKIGFLLSMEGLKPLVDDLSLLGIFYHLGLRSASLTWNNRNLFAAGIDETGGLSTLGRQAIKEMESLGIMLDLSHLNEEGFWEALELSSRPVIASHSNAYALYRHPRNLKDDQLLAIARQGGVIGINGYFTAEERDQSLNSFLDHVEFILTVAGEDHVGLGVDFNGYLGNTMVPGLEDAGKFPAITEGLMERGIQTRIIKKILGANFIRVLEMVLEEV